MTPIYSLTVLEGWKCEMSFMRLKLRCQQGWFLLEASGENAFPGLFQLLETARFPWFVGASFQPTSAVVLTPPTSL